MKSSSGMLRPKRRKLGRPRLPCPHRMPTGWDISCRKGCGCQYFPPQPTKQSYGRRSGGITSSCATESSHPTYQTIVMDVEKNLASATPLAAIREASSQRNTTINMMGSPTLQARPSPPRMCMIIPKFTQVAPYVEERKNLKGPLQRMKES